MNAQALDQLNLSYGSLAKLTADSKRIRCEFTSGRRVWIGRNGYGSSQYALLNAGKRWNPCNGTEYVSQFEVQGLPASWTRALGRILSPYLTA